MSKEMMVIALGLWIIVVRTLLGIPGSWQTAVFIVTGVLLAIIGFLLRGESLSRAGTHSARPERSSSYTFVENTPPASAAHEHKEGITSLN
jgi:hypothetical protein